MSLWAVVRFIRLAIKCSVEEERLPAGISERGCSRPGCPEAGFMVLLVPEHARPGPAPSQGPWMSCQAEEELERAPPDHRGP